MRPSNFQFLIGRWPDIHRRAMLAEHAVQGPQFDPEAAGTHVRVALEWIMEEALYKCGEPADTLFKNIDRLRDLRHLRGSLHTLAESARRLGNDASHPYKAPVSRSEAAQVVGVLHKLAAWYVLEFLNEESVLVPAYREDVLAPYFSPTPPKAKTDIGDLYQRGKLDWSDLVDVVADRSYQHITRDEAAGLALTELDGLFVSLMDHHLLNRG